MRRSRAILAAMALCLPAGPLPGLEKPLPDGLVASPEPGWPQWRGPRRDGVCREKGLRQTWPAGGCKLLWKLDGLGRGWSSPVIARGRLYITGDVAAERRLMIHAVDLTGRRRWRVANGRAWTGSFRGARASCLFDADRLYHMNAHGRVACLDAATGTERWAVNVLERFAGKTIRWGLAECLLADGPRLIVTPGGRKAMMAALDKANGRTVWASEPLGKDNASYASPILFRYGGRRHVVNCSSRHAFGVDADSGKLQWTTPRPTRWEAIATTPLYHAGSVLVAGPEDRGAERFRLVVEGDRTRIERLWLSPMMDMSGCFTLVEGRLFGSGYRRTYRGWACLDFATGKVLYRWKDLARGAHIWADGRLVCVSQAGEVLLLAPRADRFEPCGRFRPGPRKCNDFWAHPVIHDGRLYLRYHDTLWCYDVRAT